MSTTWVVIMGENRERERGRDAHPHGRRRKVVVLISQSLTTKTCEESGWGTKGRPQAFQGPENA